MRKLALVLFLIFLMISSLYAEDQTYTIMHIDGDTLLEWQEIGDNLPKAKIIPKLNDSTKTSQDLLGYLNYSPTERSQGSCGNCWQWACTGCVEIALNVDQGIFDRISIQYINSCEQDVIGVQCCDGGFSTFFTEFYNSVGHFIPWSNTNAYYQDADASCDTSCGSIAMSPDYLINNIITEKVATHGVGQEQAISNIKNILNQKKAMYFAFRLGNTEDWGKFYEFWGENESSVWNHDFACDKEYGTGAGGHAVLCVGYNDDDPNNRYWVMLNSWGTSGGMRPNGLFRVSMDINYDCILKYGSSTLNALEWHTVVPDFNIVTPTPVPEFLPGDTCANAIEVNSPLTVKDSTSEMHNFYDPSQSSSWPFSWSMSGRDYVFAVDISQEQMKDFRATVISANFDHALYLIQDCSDPDRSLIAAADKHSDQAGEELFCSVNNAGTYYLVIDSYHSGVNGDFSIDVFSGNINPTFTPTPTPTGTPTPPPTFTPTPTPTPSQLMPEEYLYTFDFGSEDWKTTWVSGVYDKPAFSTNPGSLGMSPAMSRNCYGSWQSPCHEFTPEQKYRACFRIRTDQPDQSKVPTIRVRLGDTDSMYIDGITINSTGSGANSPTVKEKTYTMFYEVPSSAADKGYFFSIDLINIGDADDSGAWVYIDMVEIKKATITVP
jgi:papain like protease